MEIINWIGGSASILGLILSITALIKVEKVKSAVKDTESRVLLNTRANEFIKKLQSYNKKFVNTSENLDSRGVKELLNELHGIADILLPIVPSELYDSCKVIHVKSKKGYDSSFYLSGKKKIFRKYIDADYMWEVYDNVNFLIDALINMQKSKKIIS